MLSGPSGAGKSTLLKRLMKEHEGVFGFSVSRTFLCQLMLGFLCKTSCLRMKQQPNSAPASTGCKVDTDVFAILSPQTRRETLDQEKKMAKVQHL